MRMSQDKCTSDHSPYQIRRHHSSSKGHSYIKIIPHPEFVTNLTNHQIRIGAFAPWLHLSKQSFRLCFLVLFSLFAFLSFCFVSLLHLCVKSFSKSAPSADEFLLFCPLALLLSFSLASFHKSLFLQLRYLLHLFQNLSLPFRGSRSTSEAGPADPEAQRREAGVGSL